MTHSGLLRPSLSRNYVVDDILGRSKRLSRQEKARQMVLAQAELLCCERAA